MARLPRLPRLSAIDWKVWRPRLAYGAFALLSFLLALRWTFPSGAVRERIVAEAAARGLALEIQDVGPGGGLLGLTARGITIDDGSGLKFPVESATASLRLWPLLAGRGSIAFDVRLWDGTVSGTADLSGDERRVVVEIAGLDLSRALPLRRASGLDLVGKLSAAADLVVPGTPQGKVGGTADARVEGAGVSGGTVPVPGMEGGLPVPRLALGDVMAQSRIEQGKATFQRLEAKGGDVEATAEDLFLVVQPRLKDSPISGRARLRIRENFWSQSGMQGLRGIAEAAMASARSGDGYLFQLSGSLARPQARPAAR
jgi:type II secretion system protein N